MSAITGQRMNFLRGRRLAFTYGVMGVILIMWCLALALWYAGGVLKVSTVRKEVSLWRARAAELDKQREEKLSIAENIHRGELSVTTRGELAKIFTNAPQWSQVMQELGARTPHQLWVKSIESKRDAKDGKVHVVIVAQSGTPRPINELMSQLKTASLLKQGELVGTTRDESRERHFEFTVQAQVVPPNR